MEFDIPTENSSDIKVIGVGGGGSNAVNHMFNQGIEGVDFIICNTDRQALDLSPVPFKIQLGKELTDGRGAGMIPDVGMNAAMENIEDIRELLSNNTKMVFVTAGMGGGTGTGAGPVIAQVAKDMGVLTVGIVTVPFNFEGRRRLAQAQDGLEKMRQNVDTLLIISNDRLKEYGKNMTLSNAFSHADNILSVAAKGIAEVIKKTGIINVDFNDVNTVMRNSGHAIMGSAQAEGESRAIDAVEAALMSPLLNDNDIHGARYILLNINYGDKEVMMDEISEITDYIEEAAGVGADVIWGHGYDESLGDQLSLTIIATGFGTDDNLIVPLEKPEPRKVVVLEDDKKMVEIKTPLTAPVDPQKEQEKNQEIEAENNEIDEPFIVSPNELVANAIEATEADDAEKVVFNLDDEADEDENQKESVSWNVSEVVDPNQSEDPITLFTPETVVRHNLDDGTSEKIDTSQVSSEEVQRNANDRVSKIQEHTAKLKKADGISEFEKEPAYMRRSIEIDNSKPSESKPSRFGLSDNEDGGADLSDNSFLHDNVD
jgi:cell division protein FtsZ